MLLVNAETVISDVQVSAKNFEAVFKFDAAFAWHPRLTLEVPVMRAVSLSTARAYVIKTKAPLQFGTV